jgi:fumarate hydratase subunit beta
MSVDKSITLPLTLEMRKELRAGDRLLLTGSLLTARDQAHRRLTEVLQRGEELPIDLEGRILFYAGPSPAPPGRVVGSVGPTTASRMDPYTPCLAEQGVAAFIGKGPRSSEVLSVLREQGALYLLAVGGIAALLGSRVSSMRVLAYPELGAEAVYELEVVRFPVIVAGDLLGGYVFSHLDNNI